MQTARPSLRSNFAWTFAGNTVHGASQWAILSLIAKLGTPEMLGQYALAVAVTMPVAMLSHLNLRIVLATDVSERHPFTDYMFVRLAATGAGLLVMAALAVLSGHAWPVALVIFLVGLSLSTENITDLYYGVMQRRERMDLVARSMITRAVLSVIAVALVLWITGSLIGAAGALVSSRLATLIFYDRRKAAPPHPEQRQNATELFRTALPLGVLLMLISLTNNIPRYAIERKLGTRELGAFAAVASFITIGAMIINALGQSATTRLAAYFTLENRARFRRLALQLIAIALGLGAFGMGVAVIAGGFVLRILYRPEYAVYKDLLVIILGAGTFSYVAVMIGYVITATRAFAAQIPLLAIVALSSAAASWWLVPQFGLRGAAAAIAVAGCVQIAGALVMLRRHL